MLLVTFGWLGDNDQKYPFMLSLAFLAGATLCFYFASSTIILLIARLMQGLSGAAIACFGQTLLLRKVGHQRIGKAMGYTGTAMSVGLVLGPVIGGGLYEIGGSQCVFLVPTGLVVAEIVLRTLIIEGKTQSSHHMSDAETQQGSNGIPEGPAFDNDHTPCAKKGQDTTYLRPDPRETQPLLQDGETKPNDHPLWIILSSSRFLVALMGSFVLNVLANGFDAILPAYCLDEFDLMSYEVSFFFLLIGVPMFLSPIAGHLSDKFGPQWPISGGVFLLIPNLFLLRFITEEVDHPYLALGIVLALIGVAFSQCMTPLQAEVAATVRALEGTNSEVLGRKGAYSQAFGLLNTSFAAGAMSGPLITGIVRVTLGWEWVTLIMAGLASSVLLPVILTTGDVPIRCHMSRHVRTTVDEGRSTV